MTAAQLIESIFSRPQQGMSTGMRRITRAQLIYLRNLIDEDPGAGVIKRGAPGSLVWMPRGDRYQFVIAEDLVGEKHSLTRLAVTTPQGMGSLF